MLSWKDISVANGAWCEASWHELCLRGPQDGRREQTYKLLSDLHMQAVTCKYLMPFLVNT